MTSVRTGLPACMKRIWCWTYRNGWRRCSRTGWAARFCSPATTTTYVSLEGRTKIANDDKADLFLSIHANSSPVKSVTGVETYYLNFTTSRAALDLAARENAPAESSIFDLKDMLEKIALKDKIDESREFASRLQTSLYTLDQGQRGHQEPRHQEGSLRGADRGADAERAGRNRVPDQRQR